MIRSRILMLMQRKIFRSVLTELAFREPDRFVRNGHVNASELARVLGVTQATVSRALSNPKYQPRKDFIDAIVKYFRVSAAQARGEDTLQADTGSDKPQFSSRAQNFAKRFDRLTANQKKALESLLSSIEEPQAGRRAM